MKNTKGIDILNLMGQGKKPKDVFLGKPLASLHEFYLTSEIGPNEEYSEWFDIIISCSENDVIKLHINCYGGDMFTAIQFMRVLTETDATVVCSVEGACMSAATMIFLTADMYEVSEHSMFMFHNYSGGTFGKGGEMFDQLKHERAWSEKILRSVYEDFLTPDEITQLLDNKDIWMDGDNAIKRLKVKSQKVKELEAKKKAKGKKKKED